MKKNPFFVQTKVSKRSAGTFSRRRHRDRATTVFPPSNDTRLFRERRRREDDFDASLFVACVSSSTSFVSRDTKQQISLEKNAREKGRREDQTTDEKNGKKERHRRRRRNERRRERSRAHQRGRGIIIYRVFMSGSLTFFFPILTFPLFFLLYVCFENVGPRPGARAGVARTRAGVFRATV